MISTSALLNLNSIFSLMIPIYFAEKNLKVIETVVNTELCKLYNWLTFNKLTLNISKSNFVIFHPKQKKPNYEPKYVYLTTRKMSMLLLNPRYILNILAF